MQRQKKIPVSLSLPLLSLSDGIYCFCLYIIITIHIVNAATCVTRIHNSDNL